MSALLRAELFRLVRRLQPRMLLITVVAIEMAGYLLPWAFGDSRDNDQNLPLSHVREMGLGILVQIGMLVCVLVAAGSIATEFGWGTIRTVLPRARSREAFLAAKVAAIGIYLAVVVAVGSLTALLASTLVTALGNLDSDLGENFVGDLAVSVVRTGWSMAPYTALAFLVALWFRSTAAGVTLTFAVFFGEVILGPLFEAGEPLHWVPENLLIFHNVEGLFEQNSLHPDPDAANPWAAALLLAGYTASFVWLAFWRFRARDITAA